METELVAAPRCIAFLMTHSSSQVAAAARRPQARLGAPPQDVVADRTASRSAARTPSRHRFHPTNEMDKRTFAEGMLRQSSWRDMLIVRVEHWVD